MRHPLLCLAALLAACQSETALEPSLQPTRAEPAAVIPSGGGKWVSRAPAETPRARATAATLKNPAGQYITYVMGGSNGNTPHGFIRVEAYNASTNKWSRKASLPAKLINGRAEALGGKIYLLGGFIGGNWTRSVFVYTPATDSWSTTSEAPDIGPWLRTAVIGNQLYALYYDFLYRFDPAAGRWTRLADLDRPHRDGVMEAIDGKLYVMWGHNTPPDAGSTVEIYDPKSDTWTSRRLPITPADEVYLGLVTAASENFNEQVYTIGGFLSDGRIANTVYAYDPKTNRLRRMANMAHYRYGPVAGKVKNASGVLQLLAIGGYSGQFGYLRSVEAFTP